MGMIQEFKDFAMRGNVVDLAVGVIIGGAFGKIVSSLVSDIIMPPLGFVLSGIDFKDLKLILQPATTNAAGDTIEAVAITYGNFLKSSLDFFIVAFCIFLLIKGINTLKKPAPVEEKSEDGAPKVPSQEELLMEIRDVLKQKA